MHVVHDRAFKVESSLLKCKMAMHFGTTMHSIWAQYAWVAMHQRTAMHFPRLGKFIQLLDYFEAFISFLGRAESTSAKNFLGFRRGILESLFCKSN